MKIQNRFLNRAVSRACATLSRALFATCRIRMIEKVPGTSPYKKCQVPCSERYLYSIWHDILMMAIFSGQPHRMAALVSRHRDGEYLADTIRIVGLKPIRGSSSRGGSQAVKQCLETAREHHISITPDGPRGPRHQMKDGIIFLASQSGRKIVPVSSRCRRYWRFQGRWTDMLLPQPFTRVLIVTGEPFSVPPGLKREELARYTRLLEQIMHDLEEEVDRMMHPENYPEEPSRREAPAKRAA